MKTILHLCADTGSDSKPYRDNGYNVILVGKDIGVENYYPPKDVYGIIANPVCTEFSIARSGGKPRNPEKGMFLVRECQRIISQCEAQGGLKFWVIENPATGALRNYLGKPDYVYQPWWFGSPWTKKPPCGVGSMSQSVYIKTGKKCLKYQSYMSVKIGDQLVCIKCTSQQRSISENGTVLR